MKKIEKIDRTSVSEDAKNELKEIGIEFFSYWEAAVASRESMIGSNTFQGTMPEAQYIPIQRWFPGMLNKNDMVG